MSKTVSLLLMTYNAGENLRSTLDSIEMQDYESVQVCIADGASTDDTLDIIRDYEATSKHDVVYVSEKDNGLYDGLNRSISLATGDYLLVMNDRFTCIDAISKLVAAIESDESYVGAHADLVYADGDRVIRNWHMGNGSIWSGWCPAHPTMMIKREIYERYGTYRLDYVSASDYEFMVRFLKDKENRLAYVPEVLVSMYVGGTSNAGVYNYWRSVMESIRAICDDGINIVIALWMTMCRTFRVALQFVRKR